MPPLTGKQRRFLRALAHSHKPVVQIGHAGLNDAVIGAIEQALETHELVKIRVGTEAQESVEEIGPRIETATHSSLAQTIGRTLLLYRQRKKDPVIVLPKATPSGSKKAAS